MISTAPFTDLPPGVAIHLVAAFLALGLGPAAHYRQRRDIWHKTIGYTWVLAMLVTSGSAFWIGAEILPVFAGYGPIHLLSVWAVYQVFRALAEVKSGDIASHQARLRGLYWTGLVVAGMFTLLPGRTFNRVLFPQTPDLAYGVMAVGLVTLIVIWRGKGVPRRRWSGA